MQQDEKKQKQRKHKVIDSEKEEETARKIAAIEAKRQEVIKDVELSLKRRRSEKIAIEKARSEAKMNIRRREIKDAKKVRGEKRISQIRRDLGAIIEAGIKCIRPLAIMSKKIKYDGRARLTIKDVRYKIKNNVHIVGWGKEAVVMSAAFERMLGKQVKKGFLVTPRKSISMMWNYPAVFPRLDSHITFIEINAEGDPDQKQVEITRRIANYCKRLKKRDLLIVMLSRDADDLLCCPRDKISLQDKLKVLNRLKTANATPEEINIVRNKLSAIRGGDLARRAYPAKVVTLIMSGVSAELSEQLAGGPCVYDPKDQTALTILTKYELFDKVSYSIRETLKEANPRSGADRRLDEGKRYKFVQQCMLACNDDAVECMAAQGFRLGLYPVKLNTSDAVEVDEFAREYAKIASLAILASEGKVTKQEMYEQMRESPVCPLTEQQVLEMFPESADKWGLGLCVVLGGRPIVHLSAHPGKGGPNQDLALRFALYWYTYIQQYPILRQYTVWFAGGSSRGRDGNTSAAGAFGYGQLVADIQSEYEKAHIAHQAALFRWRRLVEDRRDKSEIAEAEEVIKDTEEKRERYATILPERVLQENNTNLFFSRINEGDELLQLENTDYYTLADVGDLHVIRIAPYQCGCSSTCHEDGMHVDRD